MKVRKRGDKETANAIIQEWKMESHLDKEG